MKLPNEINKLLSLHIDDAECDFDNELNTDENKDYRRGFRAGVLFSFLRMKADIGDMNASIIKSSIKSSDYL